MPDCLLATKAAPWIPLCAAATRNLCLLASVALVMPLASSPALAHGVGAQAWPAPPAVAVHESLPPPAAGVAELRFADIFVRPVGPRGLQPSVRLLALAGQRVRLVGYMAATAEPLAGRLVLAPMPVELGAEDEPLADDLPPSAVFVHLSGAAAARPLPNYRGLLQLTGRLAVGAADEPDGHVSSVRLLLDEAQSQALLPPNFAPGLRGDKRPAAAAQPPSR